MVNVEVHRNLLDSLPNGGVIRMFGDANQLQPIEQIKRLQKEPSSFLKMLEKFDGIRLETIHRQAAGSSIIENGARIVVGKMPIRKEEFALKISSEPVQAVQDFVMDSLDDGFDYGGLDCQLICPTKVGWVGTEALNGALQLLLQPSSKDYLNVDRHKWIKEEYIRFYVNDKVINTNNNYPLEVFNGETGLVKGFTSDGSITIDFGDRTIDIPPSLEMQGRNGIFYINPQKDIDLAYAITTHKAQGSEYQRVCYIMNGSRSWTLNRKNFYTGISRAREHVTVLTDSRALTLSLQKAGDK